MSEPWAEAVLFYGLAFKPGSPAHVRLDAMVADTGEILYRTRTVRLGTHGPLDAPCYHVAAIESITRVDHHQTVARVLHPKTSPTWRHQVRVWCNLRGVPIPGALHASWHLAVTYEP